MNDKAREARFDLLLDRYWNIAHAEGREGRDHDTESGDAQATLCALKDEFRAALQWAALQQAAEGEDELQRLRAKVDALTREAWTWSKACESESMRIHGVKDAINKAYGIVSKEHPWTPEHSKNYPQQAANIINAAMTIFAPPATQGGAFLPGEYERMTEDGRKAWDGVDPQDLRAGGDGQAPQGECRVCRQVGEHKLSCPERTDGQLRLPAVMAPQGEQDVPEGCTPHDAKVLREANHAFAEENQQLRKALRFYASREHFNLADSDAWDTVSGEPQNWWCDDAGTATIEDGAIAAMALRGESIDWGGEEGLPEPPICPGEPEALITAPTPLAQGDSQ